MTTNITITIPTDLIQAIASNNNTVRDEAIKSLKEIIREEFIHGTQEV